jgi:hypothetical protein
MVGFSVLVALILAACGSGSGSQETTQVAGRPLRGCPPQRPNLLRAENQNAASELAPVGPSSALVCRYVRKVVNNVPTEREQITEGRLGRGASLDSLVSDLNSLTPTEPGEVACGEIPSAPEYLVALHYRGAPDVYVWTSYNYCSFVGNALDRTTFVPTSTLKHELDMAEAK